MKILHVIPFGIFTVGYINSFYEGDMYSHTFWMYGYSKEYETTHKISFKKNKNVVRVDKFNYPSFENQYIKNDLIIFLCIPENLELLELVQKCYKNHPKPYVLSPWGRDADRTSDIYNMKKSVWFPIDQMKCWLITHSACIASTQKLYETLEKNYQVKSPRKFFGNNLLAFKSNELSALNIIEPHKNLHIMTGHRGTRTCRHIKMFHMITPRKKDIACVVCPLSYGEASYIRIVQLVGKIKFKNKWEPITEWMDADSYMHFLNENVDAAIFASRFEAASTIYALLYMGKTIYLNEHSETAELLDDIGISYYKIAPDCKELQLRTLSEKERKRNRMLMEDFGSIERFNKQWENLINECYEKWINEHEELV